MNAYVVLLRGINVGGKNKVSMATLKKFLEDQGFENVRTFLNSGNVILESKLNAESISQKIEKSLPKVFKLDSSIIKILVLSSDKLQKIAAAKPKGFGEQPDKYYSDVIFLIDVSASDAFKVFSPKEGVDKVWQGESVIYSQRLGSKRTQSRLNKIVATPFYRSMTIRSWNTTSKLVKILEST